MSALVKLSSKLPGDFEVNGIDQQVEELIDEPKALRIAVVWYDTLKVTMDTDSGDQIPTIRVRRIEPLGVADDVTDAIKKTVSKAMQERTGRTPLPFNITSVEEDKHSDPIVEVD